MIYIYNRLKDELKLITLIPIISIIIALVFGREFSIFFFIWMINLTVMPIFLKEESISWTMKIVIVLSIATGSILAIYYLGAMERMLYLYMMILIISVLSGVRSSLRGKK